jgi:hypothetical protein
MPTDYQLARGKWNGLRYPNGGKADLSNLLGKPEHDRPINADKLGRCAAGGPCLRFASSIVKDGFFVDNATKRSLKQPDQFISFTENKISWANKNRQQAIAAGTAVVVLILAIVGGYTLYQHRTDASMTAFGTAMETYNTPVVTPGQQVPPGMKTFATSNERAKAANAQFMDVAHKYGMLHEGKLALYFGGLTYAEEGQNASAEEALKSVAGSWDSGLSSLSKMALAQLYEQTGRNQQAADIYNELASSKSSTVPPNLAKLQLAELYTSEGKTADAKAIYAKLKDTDKDKKGNLGAAGQIAQDKLNPKAAPQQ